MLREALKDWPLILAVLVLWLAIWLPVIFLIHN